MADAEAKVQYVLHDGQAAAELVDEMARLYQRVYAEPPYNSAPRFSPGRFISRTREQAMTSGFILATARRGGVLVGYTFGFTMEPGAWWVAASRPSEDVMACQKFAVIELLVDRAHRRQGIGHTLLTMLLRDRPEPYATLVAVLEADAYGWYLRNGWRKVGELRLEPPFADALLLPLPATA